MKTTSLFFPLTSSLLLAACSSIPNSSEADVMINGNCEQCEETIEQAAYQEGIAEADWDMNTRHATITFDSTKTSLNAVLNRIANAGYDNQAFIASDSAYDDLPQCCRYKRTGKTVNPPQPGETGHGH